MPRVAKTPRTDNKPLAKGHATRFAPPVVSARRALGLTVLAVVAFCEAAAQAVHRDGFDTPTPVWRLADSDCAARLVAQERIFERSAVHAGAGAEFLRLRSGQGSYAHLTLAVPPARVIQELRPTLWVKANRPGLQLRARIVLPRSRDPRDGSLLTVLVEGDRYDQPGAWRQLAIRDLPLQVQRQARIKRAQPQFDHVDEREAYLDLLVLNGHGGAGVTDIWIDDLEIEGHNEASRTGTPPLAGSAPGGDEPWRPAHPSGDSPVQAPAGLDQPPRLEGATLVAGRGPIAVRMIEHQGESWSWLQALGFNALRLPRPPTSQELEEARRLNLRLVAPPPHATGRTEITAMHDCVLAWDMGSGLGVREQESVRQLAQAVRRDDLRTGRPVLVGPRESFWSYRRCADILLLGENPWGTSRSLADYGSELTRRASQTSRTAPFWALVPAAPHRPLRKQWEAFVAGGFDLGATEGSANLGGEPTARAIADEASLEAAQIHALAWSALAAGAGGLCIGSDSPLDVGSPAAQHRAAVLHALNLDMSLFEPWIAGPSRRESLTVGGEGIRAASWRTERSQLVAFTRFHADDQFVAAPCPPLAVSFVAPGAPPSWKAYRVLPDRLEPVWSNHVGGGARISLPDVGRWAAVVITDDPLTINFLASRLRQDLPVRARLWHEIVSRELAAAERVLARTPSDAASRNDAARALDEARAGLRRCETLLDASDFAGSLSMAEIAQQALAQARRRLWAEAVSGFASRTASPCCAAFAVLPLHWELMQRVRASAWGPNALAAGDFEDVEHLRASGWTQQRIAEWDGQTSVELSPDQPRSGRYALRLRAASTTGARTHEAADAPAVRVVSAPAAIERGAVARITGWVRVVADASDRPVLRIVDSLGGETLSETFRPQHEWRMFAVYRAALRPERLTIAFELLEPGDVWIDGVSVEAMPPAGGLSRGPRPPPQQGAQGLTAGQPQTLAH